MALSVKEGMKGKRLLYPPEDTTRTREARGGASKEAAKSGTMLSMSQTIS
jgi:hypothetical protein